jgi:hypothetical protein
MYDNALAIEWHYPALGECPEGIVVKIELRFDPQAPNKPTFLANLTPSPGFSERDIHIRIESVSINHDTGFIPAQAKSSPNDGVVLVTAEPEGVSKLVKLLYQSKDFLFTLKGSNGDSISLHLVNDLELTPS